MNTSEQYYIYSLLNPEDRIITGNAKRYEPVKVYQPIPPKLTEAEHDKSQDEYLEWVQSQSLTNK
jgi:hypothetical protein